MYGTNKRGFCYFLQSLCFYRTNDPANVVLLLLEVYKWWSTRKYWGHNRTHTHTHSYFALNYTLFHTSCTNYRHRTPHTHNTHTTHTKAPLKEFERFLTRRKQRKTWKSVIICPQSKFRACRLSWRITLSSKMKNCLHWNKSKEHFAIVLQRVTEDVRKMSSIRWVQNYFSKERVWFLLISRFWLRSRFSHKTERNPL